jgi:hypothetical protein
MMNFGVCYSVKKASHPYYAHSLSNPVPAHYRPEVGEKQIEEVIGTIGTF